MAPSSRWLIGLAYPAAGLVLGLADPLLGSMVGQLGLKPGVATAVSVNLLLPLVAVGLALLRPRLGSVWFGAVTMTLALIAGLAARYGAGIKDWSPVALVMAVPPVLVVALFGYALLGTIAALVGRSWRARGVLNGHSAS
jgi:hypothetical protein